MDFDGTILDSNSLKAACFGKVFAPFGKTSAQFATSYHFRHLSQPRLEKITTIAKELELNLSDRELEKLSELFGNLVMDQISTCSLVPGVTEFFEWARDKWPLYVCSATPLGELKRILESMGIASHFKEIFGYPTTKEEAMVEIGTSLGCPCSRILMIGDASAMIRGLRI
jgi:phosphoglycolate phosphatase-like HAD superfamily hydrolase